MKRTLLTAALLGLATLGWSITADEIIDKMEAQNKHDSTQARIAATIEEKGGATSERLIDQFSVTEKDLSKSVAVFQKPASVKDTRFLMVENDGRDDDRWIYLPTLKKVRRIASSEGSTSFIGEITYDDMAVGSQDRKHTLLKEDTLEGEEVYVVESVTNDPAQGQYSRTVSAVSKTKWLPVRVEMFDKQNKLLKVLDTLEFKQIQGSWSPMKLRMANVQNGNTTTLTFQILEYGKKIPAGVFTTKFLEAGRP